VQIFWSLAVIGSPFAISFILTRESNWPGVAGGPFSA
jgi:hypothetical protein